MQLNTHIHHNFNKIIKSTHQNSSLLIAISGGKDSICLIRLIHDFIKENKFINKIEYIYIDHQWRIDSKFNITHLINYLNEQGNLFSIYQLKNLTKSEMQARNLRYQIIIQHAIKHKFTHILTGHTKSDKTETVLQKLIRGTTIDGITNLNIGKEIIYNIQLIRPLLETTEAEIKWFTKKFLLPIWSDETNYHYNISRNRIRYELIPYIKQYYNTNIINQLDLFIEDARLDNDYIKQSALKLYIIIMHPKYIAINQKLLKQQHSAIQKRIIRMFLYHNFQKNLNQNIVLQIIQNIKTNENQRLYISDMVKHKNLFINFKNQWIYIS